MLQGEQGDMSLRGGKGDNGGISCNQKICGVNCFWHKGCC